MNGSHDLFSDASIDELDNIRLREITGKAVSGILVLLLKWFKRSREFPMPRQALKYTANF
jgi:hypothetical protein